MNFNIKKSIRGLVSDLSFLRRWEDLVEIRGGDHILVWLENVQPNMRAFVECTVLSNPNRDDDDPKDDWNSVLKSDYINEQDMFMFDWNGELRTVYPLSVSTYKQKSDKVSVEVNRIVSPYDLVIENESTKKYSTDTVEYWNDVECSLNGIRYV